MRTKAQEFLQKRSDLLTMLRTKGYGGIELSRQPDFSWITCGGRGFVGFAGDASVGSVFLTPEGTWLLANDVESPRLLREEMDGLADVVEPYMTPWFELGASNAAFMEKRLKGKPCLRGNAANAEMITLRSSLHEEEIARYASLGRESATVLEEVCKSLQAGISEYEAAGRVSSGLWAQGIEPITVLVAFDERLRLYRHPVPTDNRLQKTAMIAICARRHGLVASASRVVSLGVPSLELLARHKAVTEVDACMIFSTVPGMRVKDVFRRALRAYGDAGFEGEWKLHHQGGLTGYEAREYVATEDSRETVSVNQAFAWNPTIAGTKSEDTFVVRENGPQLLTDTGKFPAWDVAFEGKTIWRPAILTL